MFDPDKWVCAEQIFVPKGPPSTAVFFNTATGDGISFPWNGYVFNRGVWTRVDLSGLIPVDAKAVNLQGLFVITHGQQQETANLRVNFKPPSSNENPLNYEGQTIEPWVGGGQRVPFATWCAVENGQFDFWWEVAQLGPHPSFSAYLVNLNVQGFAR